LDGWVWRLVQSGKLVGWRANSIDRGTNQQRRDSSGQSGGGCRRESLPGI
jgi:hypothetical protein